jgi:hypothetical protein
MKLLPLPLVSLTAALALLGCTGETQREPAAPPPAEPSAAAPRPVTERPRSGYLETTVAARNSAEARVGAASLTAAIRQFESMESRKPASLEELIAAGYLPALPDAPRGAHWVYDPQSGAVYAGENAALAR